MYVRVYFVHYQRNQSLDEGVMGPSKPLSNNSVMKTTSPEAAARIEDHFYKQLAKSTLLSAKDLVRWAKKKNLIDDLTITEQSVTDFVKHNPLLGQFSLAVTPKVFASLSSFNLGSWHVDLGFYKENYKIQNSGFRGFALFCEKLTLKIW